MTSPAGPMRCRRWRATRSTSAPAPSSVPSPSSWRPECRSRRSCRRTAPTATISSSVVVPEDSDDQDGAEDLIGKKIAVNTLGANAEAVLDTWFAQEGLTPGGDRPDHPGGAATAEHRGGPPRGPDRRGLHRVHRLPRRPLRSRASCVSVVKDIDVIGPYNGGGLTLRDDFLEENPEDHQELVAGVAKAVEFHRDPRPSGDPRRLRALAGGARLRRLRRAGRDELGRAAPASAPRRRIADEGHLHLARLAREPRATSTPTRSRRPTSTPTTFNPYAE